MPKDRRIVDGVREEAISVVGLQPAEGRDDRGVGRIGASHRRPLIMRSAPEPCLVLAERRELALGEVRIFLHGRLHLLCALALDEHQGRNAEKK